MNVGSPLAALYSAQTGRQTPLTTENGEPVRLGEGDRVMAEVTETKTDGTVALRLANGQQILAEVLADRALVPGQRVMLSVTAVRDGVPMVEIAGEGVSSAETYLNAMKAPKTEQNLTLAREAILQQAVFTPKQFAALSKAFAAFEALDSSTPQPGMDAASRGAEQVVFMARHNIPVSRETIARYQDVTRPQMQLGALLQKVMDLLPPERQAPQTPQTQQQTAAQSAPQTTQTGPSVPQALQQPHPQNIQPAPAQAEQPLPQILQQSQPQQAAAPQLQQAASPQTQQPLPAQPQTEQPARQPASMPQPTQTERPAQPAPQMRPQQIAGRPVSASIPQQAVPVTPQNQPVQPGTPPPLQMTQTQTAPAPQPVQAEQPAPALPQPSPEPERAGTPPAVRSQLDAAFARVSSGRGAELPRELDVPKLTREIGRVITSVIEAARDLPEQSRSEILQTAREIVQTLRFTEQINHCAAYAQLPVTINGEKTTAQLYVFNDSTEKKKIDPQNATMFVSLRTANLGTVEGFIKVVGTGVEADFSLQTEESARLFRAGLPELKGMLETRGYRLERISAAVVREEEPLPPAAVEKGRAAMAGRYTFNRTV